MHTLVRIWRFLFHKASEVESPALIGYSTPRQRQVPLVLRAMGLVYPTPMYEDRAAQAPTGGEGHDHSSETPAICG